MKIKTEKIRIRNTEIYEITMENTSGMTVSFLNLGGIITRILVPDNEGNVENVVLSYSNYEEYLTNPGYFGAIIGRTAGRIKDAQFELNGTVYNLSKNYGDNHGHGGVEGFSKKLFKFECFRERRAASVKLSYLSEHMEEGYPGEVLIEVTYSLNEDNEFKILYEAYPKEDTLINLTNHTYFNLSGSFEESILYHELMVNAEKFAETDSSSSVTGKLIGVEGTAFDFRYMREIGEEIKEEHPQLIQSNGYDHPYLLKKDSSPKVRLAHRFSGRVLEIESDNDCVIVYTQNYTSGQQINAEITLRERRAIALEFQRLPIGKNGVFKEASIVRKNEVYRTQTTYRFMVEESGYGTDFVNLDHLI